MLSRSQKMAVKHEIIFIILHAKMPNCVHNFFGIGLFVLLCVI